MTTPKLGQKIMAVAFKYSKFKFNKKTKFLKKIRT